MQRLLGWCLAEQHDEPLTLATTFLAAGRLPARALRDAQLWMLDDDAPPPPGMPATLATPVYPGRNREPASWAGYAHQGCEAASGNARRRFPAGGHNTGT